METFNLPIIWNNIHFKQQTPDHIKKYIWFLVWHNLYSLIKIHEFMGKYFELPEDIHIEGYCYKYDSTLTAGYFDPIKGWHLLGSGRKLVYNIDIDGNLFYNKKV
jgi:hypothetical protein